MGIFTYFKFLINSTNEHGVHSPFVFSFITRGLYAKDERWKRKDRIKNFVDRVLAYFKPNKVMIFSNKQNLSLFNNYNPKFISALGLEDLKEGDIIFIDETSNFKKEELINNIHKLKNDAFVMVDKRVSSVFIEDLWRGLVDSDRTTVTIDFYFYGLVFVRLEQLKQHFKLRL